MGTRIEMPDRDGNDAMLPAALVLLAFSPPTVVAQPFALRDVWLTGGPLKAAMDADLRYLRSLDVDRLLSGFEKGAGRPHREPYGGWEKGGYGMTAGHYLSAISYAYAATGDPEWKRRADRMVAELAACQSTKPDGSLTTGDYRASAWNAISGGKVSNNGFVMDAGLSIYTIHKIFAGLLDANRYVHSADALTVADRLGRWMAARLAPLSEAQMQTLLGAEWGGMNESFAVFYARTGNPVHLATARRFYQKGVMDPLAADEDRLNGLHANTQIPKIVGEARLYELTGDPRRKAIAENFWTKVVDHHTYAIGGNSDHEHFGPPDQERAYLTTDTAESCNTYNMEKLTRHLFEWEPKAAYGDWYERALFNHVLGSQDPQTGMMTYFVPLVANGERKFSTPYDDFWCCVGTGMENHVLHGSGLYYHRGNDRLWVDLFAPSVLSWGDLRIEQTTGFPNDGRTSLRVVSGAPRRFTMTIRHPEWAGPYDVLVNGKPFLRSAKPGFFDVARVWKKGDVIGFAMPMRLRTEPVPDDPTREAVLYGPLVLTAQIDAPTPYAPVLVTNGKPVDAWMRRLPGSSLAFETVGVGRPNHYRYEPFAEARHVRTAVYLQTFDDRGWAEEKARYEAEERARLDREARTTDVFRPGEMQPERDHGFLGERTQYGGTNDKWRDARDGGWFSFAMAVDPAAPMTLFCSYYGSDNGREWDILVDGTKVAHERLTAKHPLRRYEEAYAIPAALTRGKDHVTIRFQASPGGTAGGLWGARMEKDAPLPSGRVRRGEEQGGVHAFRSRSSPGGEGPRVRSTVMIEKPVFADVSRGKPFSKDPYVVRFKGRLFMYYSVPPYGDGRERDGWRVGIAEGTGLDHWKRIGEIVPVGDVETKGLCAPCAVVVGDELHLFYQSYGNGPRDAICHAVSKDGVAFLRDPSNPVFRPTGVWNNGRAIDAEVVLDGERSLLYFATRDPEGKRQMVGVATAPRAKGFGRDAWTLAVDGPVLAPTLLWERDCIEAPSVQRVGDRYAMLYAGAYNNEPQQIGLAWSDDGLHWTRASEEPFVRNGRIGEWNSSESGHPDLYRDEEGGLHLFFQGNDTAGNTWSIAHREIRLTSPQ